MDSILFSYVFADLNLKCISNEINLQIQDSIWFRWILLDSVRFHWIPLDPFGFQDSVGFYWIPLDSIGFR